MEVKAIVLLETAGAPSPLFHGRLSMADVLGRPAAHHLVRHLHRQNVSEVAVISDAPLESPVHRETAGNWSVAAGPQLWRAAENIFIELAQNGAEEILVLRMGAYVEPDIDALLQAHMDNRTHATRALAAGGSPMDLFVVAASRRNEAAYLFRHRLCETRTRCGFWNFRGYSNALATAQHLRCLAVDALLGENAIEPAGHEVRPGVWVARGAVVHPRARVLSPAFVGAHSRIGANAVLTRCGVVEHHVQVEYGTVIEDATVLPYTCIGPGLDVMHSVAGAGRLANLRLDVEVEIADPRLLRTLASGPGRRALSGAAALFSFLPALVRRRFGGGRRNQPEELPAAVSAPSALDTPPGFPAASSAVEASSWQRSWR